MSYLQRMVQVRVGPPGGTGKTFGDRDDGTPGLDVEFETHAGDYERPAECVVRIFNMSADSRRMLSDRTNVAIVRVGYQGQGYKAVFTGNPTPETLSVEKSSGDWVTTITLRDGGLAFDRGRVDVSFAGSTSGRQVLDEILRQTGLGEGQADVAGISFPRRYVYSGPAKGAIRELAKLAGPTHRWFIRDGNLFILGATQTTPETGPVFSSELGNLVGSPESSDDGTVRFRGMLDTTVRVGRVVKLESRFISGWFKVVEASFQGNNFGGAFYVHIKGVKYQ